ncbi:phosphoribosyltransferase [Streptomyces yangpuensis]|uniref:phosphoribosyltransferase n=1 Tax=Streptomyces yangpuensis TaxID=1648182 RepID=UPI003645BDCE
MSAPPPTPSEGPDTTEPLYLSWEEIGLATATLAQQTAAAGVPQAVVGIVRGGLIPAVWIAHRLGVHDVRTIEVTRTTSDDINAAKAPLPTLRNPASLGDLTGLDVLLVDDIAGSGTTLAHTARIVQELGPARVRTAVLAVNRANWPAGPEPHHRIDHIARQTATWVVFPWEEQHDQR